MDKNNCENAFAYLKSIQNMKFAQENYEFNISANKYIMYIIMTKTSNFQNEENIMNFRQQLKSQEKKT